MAYPSLLCSGLVDGTSGAPWTVGPTITGLVGGLDGGGCDETVTYSPPFDGEVVALLTRAEAGGPADPAPGDFDRRLLTYERNWLSARSLFITSSAATL